MNYKRLESKTNKGSVWVKKNNNLFKGLFNVGIDLGNGKFLFVTYVSCRLKFVENMPTSDLQHSVRVNYEVYCKNEKLV